MKKLFLKLAMKMEPSIIQNILLRLSTKTPKMFKILQLYCGGIAIVLASVIEILDTHQIPDFKFENIVVIILKFLAAIIAGIAGGMSLHTEDSDVHDESQIISK